MSRSISRALALAAGLAVIGPAATAQSVEEFYSGNTITFVISAAPGGGADFYGRTFAPYFASYIPGQPEVVIQNVPGAGGMRAAIQLNSTEPDDGTVVALLQRNNFYLPLVSDQEIAFDPLDVNWLGSINAERYVLMAMASADVTTPDGLFEEPLSLAATGFANENRTIPEMMNRFSGTQLDIVPGYEGSSAISLAMERGEIDGRMQVISAITHGPDAQWYNDGTINILMQVARTPSEDFPEVPNLLDYSTDETALSIANFMLSPLDASVPVATPGGVPEERVAALREAFDRAASDPEMLAELARGRGPATTLSGAEVEQIVRDLWATPEPVLDEIRTLLAPQ